MNNLIFTQNINQQNMKSILLSLISIMVLYSCSDKAIDSSANTYRIDFKNSAPTSDFIKSTELIALETNDSSLIKSIRKIEYYKDYIYVFDHDQRIVVIFDKEGKHINTINNKGQGPEEYIDINDFGIDRFSNQIYLLCPFKQTLFYYDLLGKLVDMKKLPTLTGGTYMSLQLPNKDTFMFLTADSNNRLKIMDGDDDSFILEDFPRKEYDGWPYLFADSLFLPDLSNQVYSYSAGKLEKSYQIDIASLSPELKIKNTPKPNDRQSVNNFINKLVNSENIDFLIKQIDETSKFILVSFWRKSLYYTYIIEKETGSFYSFNSIDEYFGPFIKYMNDDFIIGLHNSELNEMYAPLVSKSDLAILKNKSLDSNPILIKYNFKK